MPLFEREEDYPAPERVLLETPAVRGMQPDAYCLMPNPRHQVRWPCADGEMAAFMLRLSVR